MENIDMTNNDIEENKSFSFDDKIIERSKSAPPRPLNETEEFKKSKMFL